MKSLTEHLWMEVPERRGFVNLTPTIGDLVARSGVHEGLCLFYGEFDGRRRKRVLVKIIGE